MNRKENETDDSCMNHIEDETERVPMNQSRVETDEGCMNHNRNETD